MTGMASSCKTFASATSWQIAAWGWGFLKAISASDWVGDEILSVPEVTVVCGFPS